MSEPSNATAALPRFFDSTAELEVPKRLADQIVGQDESVEIIKKAAVQKRNVLLIGIPGTGKSMLAQALSEILPVQRLEDVLIYPNNLDPNVPLVRVQKAGTARKMLDRMRMDSMAEEDTARTTGLILSFAWFVFAYLIWSWRWISDIIYAALLIVGTVLLLGVSLGSQMRPRTGRQIPKLLVDNLGKKTAPFVEATGARAGALLGDVRHDPLQSGGLGTPPHLRVEPGMIHRANGGVLFLDEIATLSARAQQELLTVMQEKKYSITGQSENSSGAMTRTEPVPADFVLVAAGNYQDLEKVHPALRSRIRGYGYEVYMNNDMPDNEENVKKICQFVAQEVKKDGKIPHFSFDATQEIVFEARRRAGRKNRLTLKLRDLGGLIRAAGDLAKAKAHLLVLPEDVFEAKMSARTLEQQMVGKLLDHRKDYDIFLNKGAIVGRVNGLAVTGDDAGLILPIEAEVAPAQSSSEGKIIATGKLGEIAKEAVQNVSALMKKLSSKDISRHDLHIQFLQTYEGVEGDSASISVATAVISALERIPIRQDIAMTGSLSVRGEVLPVGGVTAKVSAAIKAGFSVVLVPASNVGDIILSAEDRAKVTIIPVKTLSEVLENSFVKSADKTRLLKNMRALFSVDIGRFLGGKNVLK